MTENTYLERSVVPLIESQFPLFYRERYPQFVAFYKAYHEWLESSSGAASSMRLTRDFLDLRDVDRTTTEFLIYLKQKYVRDLKLDTLSDTRQLIKHAKDLYRAKGTPRALDLFFRLLYDEVISIYYPKDDLLIPSSGKWNKPRYLELSLSPDAVPLEGKQIYGVNSGATAFVDSVVKRVFNKRLAVTAYISAIQGSFELNEFVAPVDGSIPIENCPSVVGSLTGLLFDASGSGAGYSVGDIVPINSNYGVLGQARVSNTVIQTGLIDLTLNDGGYGYTNATVLTVSDVVVNLSNVAVSNAYARKYFNNFDNVVQPLATYTYNNANGSFNPGDTIRAYTNAAVTGTGTVLRATPANSTSGILFVSILSGNLQANAIYTSSNAVAANLYVTGGGYIDATASAQVVGTSDIVLQIANTTGFAPGETIIQNNPLFPSDRSIQAVADIDAVTSSGLRITNRTGVFRMGGSVTGQSSGTVANIASIQITVGLKTTNGTFSVLPGNYTYAPSVNGSLSFVGSHISASFGISPVLTNTETVYRNRDSLAAYANLALDAATYGFPGNTSANASSFFSTYLSFENVVVGTITNVYTITSSAQTDSTPIIAIVEGRDSTLNDFDLVVYYSNATLSFSSGEVITQAATQARGKVKSINSTALVVTNLRMDQAKQFVPTTNSTTYILGSSSGSTANATSVWADRCVPVTGRNASATTITINSNGAVTEAEVIDSGFGYVDTENVWLGFGIQTGDSATAIANVAIQGKSRGFYTSTDGFLSSNKKLFDGDYYQNFSYEIGSSHQLDKYVDTLKKVVHVAGMKVFGRYIHIGDASNPISTTGSTMKIS